DIKHVRRDVSTFEHRHSPAGKRDLTVLGTQHATLAKTFKSKPLVGDLWLDVRQPGTLERQTLMENQMALELEDYAMLMSRQDNYLISQALQGSIAMQFGEQNITVDYGIPASNKFSTADATIPVDWENPDADILTDLKNMKLAISRNSGRTARFAWCSSRVMTALLNNENVREFVGRSVIGAQILEQGYVTNLMGLDWRISDETYTDENGGNVTPYLDEKTIVIHPSPDREWGCFRIGSATVPKNDGSGLVEVIGKYAYSGLERNPAAITLYTGYVRLPLIKVPAALARAKVIV
ncbi:MAG TPA: major capsid protein, partial [Planctomycetota bacterium]|nr:major capsid protein [Planctomycetota bacterium]